MVSIKVNAIELVIQTKISNELNNKNETMNNYFVLILLCLKVEISKI